MLVVFYFKSLKTDSSMCFLKKISLYFLILFPYLLIGQTTDLIISEYVEGSSNNKYIEIYNGTGSAVDLSDYQLLLFSNGASTPSTTSTLSGILNNGSVIVYKNSAATKYLGTATVLSAVNFNGDDAIALYKISTASYVDIFGNIGCDPGSAWTSTNTTVNQTLVRNSSVCSGISTDNTTICPFPTLDSEWTQYPQDDVSNLGTHTASCSCTAPATQSSSISFSGVTESTMTLTWTVGDGSNRVVIMNTVNSFTNPTDGTDPTANTVYGGAGEQVIYNGNGNTVSVSGLTPGATYWFRVYEYNCTGTNTVYNVTTALNNPNSQTTLTCSAPTVQSSSITFSSVGSTSMSLSWTTGDGANRIVIMNTVNSFTNPVNGTDPTANTVYGGAGEQVIYNGAGNTVTVSGLTASTTYWFRVYEYNCSGTNTIYYTATALNNPNSQATTVAPVPAVLSQGDFAVVGVCSNIASCIGGSSAGDDEISFVCFKDITTGTTIDMTDEGWERCNANQWGNSEGFLRIRRTGGTITAGTVITIRLNQVGAAVTGVYPDNNWAIDIDIRSLVLNSNGDQIYFMQGGTWDDGNHTCDVPGGTPGLGASDCHDATYTGGEILFGFNTNQSWTSGICSASNTSSGTGRSQNSGLIGGMDCFTMMPGVATDYIKYTGTIDGFGTASQREWIRRFNDPANWTSFADCATYYSTAPNYETGYTFSIGFGGFTDGLWTGTKDTNWFECQNWQSMRVPTSSINVVIPNVSTYDPMIFAAGAVCNDISILANGSLTINDVSSTLDIYGDMTNSGTYSHTNGTVSIIDDNSSITANNPINFYNLAINKTSNTNTVTLNSDIEVSNQLDLTNGIVVTGTNKVNVSTTTATAIVNHSTNSYINGNLRRSVNTTGSYDFPVGTSAQYELANINLNTSAGISYIDAFFTNPHSTAIDISPLALTLNSTPVTTLLDYGFWTISPDAYSSVDYDVTITSRGHSNGGANAAQHTVVKRINNLNDWNIYPANHNNATQSGTGTAAITAKLTNLTAFSDFAIARSDNYLLPVELLTFNAKLKDNVVELNWITKSEKNNDFFVIEKSVDGNDFQEIEKIQGAGNSNNTLSYLAFDRNPLQGINYYRLKQYDYDGKSFTSDIITVNFLNDIQNQDFVSELIINDNKISINLTYPQEVKFQLIDITGKTILSQTDNRSLMNIDITNLAKGLYFIKISSNTQVFNYKFINQ